MMDDALPSSSQVSGHDFEGPSGPLRRALYLWERQPPSESRPVPADLIADSRIAQNEAVEPPSAEPMSADGGSEPADSEIEESLKRHAARLSALERIIPGDRRLDPPRFSLMMLNAFLGRAVMDGAILARLPGLFSISERIDGELADLEIEYPDAIQDQPAEPDPTPVVLRDEMRQFFADLKSAQKAQQRQVVSSLAALHTAIHELRAQLPDRLSDEERLNRRQARDDDPAGRKPPDDDLARPLIDSERLLDPRPVLVAARAAASRATVEVADHSKAETQNTISGLPQSRPYKSVLLGSAVLGLLMIVFGREAVQFLSSASLNHGLARP